MPAAAAPWPSGTWVSNAATRLAPGWTASRRPRRRARRAATVQLESAPRLSRRNRRHRIGRAGSQLWTGEFASRGEEPTVTTAQRSGNHLIINGGPGRQRCPKASNSATRPTTSTPRPWTPDTRSPTGPKREHLIPREASAQSSSRRTMSSILSDAHADTPLLRLTKTSDRSWLDTAHARRYVSRLRPAVRESDGGKNVDAKLFSCCGWRCSDRQHVGSDCQRCRAESVGELLGAVRGVQRDPSGCPARR